MGLKIVIPDFGRSVANYERAVREQGGEPVVMQRAEAKPDISAMDGLVLPGGPDVDPARYGEENTGCLMVDRKLDALQLAYLDAFVQARKPVLGICRGHQLINVYFGGTLIQDVPEREKHAKNAADEPDRYHEVEVSGRDSWVFALYGRTFRVNSAHHQAVDRLAEDLVPDLYSTGDRLIEGTHHRELPVWTVQWHPERCHPSKEQPDAVNGAEVFRFFMGKIREMQQS